MLQQATFRLGKDFFFSFPGEDLEELQQLPGPLARGAEAPVYAVGASGAGGGGESCSVLSDFSNFPTPAAAAFAMSPPLAGLRWCCQAPSCWRFLKEEEKEEKGEECGDGKGALPWVTGGREGSRRGLSAG